MGIQSFNAKYSCLWCKCLSELRFETTKNWSMFDTTQSARTVEEISMFARAKKGEVVQYGYTSVPLFSVIPVHRVVPDTLHLFLRIADQLVNHLLVELRNRDNLANTCKSIDIEKCNSMKTFETFVNSLGIEWKFCVEKGSNIITSRDFQGPELWKIFNSIKLTEIIPGHPKLNHITKLWDDFIGLISKLKLQMEGNEVLTFQQEAVSWLDLFCKIYMTKNVTPYMYVLVKHIPEALKFHGN
ncbi:hypothetical protein HOLleu_04741 [Holothuria leucospilota]|uniref:Uncharacterized protein n=1 Tax=Holothuria leucospilota TaxID=206669 RepID=A0A9Q1HIH6_HOLLE|nr:hypothetical protein HOLleu_04741 [Holothuria leucospilota]